MSVQRFQTTSVTSLAQIQGQVDPAATLGPFGTVSTVDIVLADDTELPALTELMTMLGYAFVATAPAATDVVSSQVNVTDMVGLAAAPPLAAAGHARWYFDTATGFTKLSVNGGAYQIAVPPNDSQVLPVALNVSIAQTTRALGATFEGGAYLIPRRTTITTLNGRMTAGAAGATVRYALYQVPGGLAVGVANLLATGTFVSVGGAPVNFTIPMATTLDQGILYVLCGLGAAAPAFTNRVYTSPAIDLVNGNGVAGLAPVAFTTAISSLVAPPATFNPVAAGVLSAVALVPIIRFN